LRPLCFTCASPTAATSVILASSAGTPISATAKPTLIAKKALAKRRAEA
jgi:hypothetical protein